LPHDNHSLCDRFQIELQIDDAVAVDFRFGELSARRLFRLARLEHGSNRSSRHREVWIKGFVDRVIIGCATEVIAEHIRSYDKDDITFDPVHYLRLPELLNQIPPDQDIGSVTADGAYDTRKCHEAIAARNAHTVIPPRKNAKPWKPTSAGAIPITEPVGELRLG